MVKEKIDELHSLGKIPIIEGGSCFYLNYLLTATNDPYDEKEWENAEIEAFNLI